MRWFRVISPPGRHRLTETRKQESVSDVRDPERDQSEPTGGEGSPIHELVADDILERMHHGTRKYGTALRAFNGRNALLDAYEEALDLAVYLRQALIEQDERIATFDDRCLICQREYADSAVTCRPGTPPGGVEFNAAGQACITTAAFCALTSDEIYELRRTGVIE